MQIWLDTNIKAHNFIPKGYWTGNFDLVQEMIPQTDVYVYEDDNTDTVKGFVGVNDNYIEGIFVECKSQSKGIGKQLLDYVKAINHSLTLCVYQKNKSAVKFYQRESFVIQSVNIDENTGEKELVMLWKRQMNSVSNGM